MRISHLDQMSLQIPGGKFDSMLQKLLDSMRKIQSDEGSITMKIDISIEQKEGTDRDGNLILIDTPVLKHTISTQVPVKDQTNGKKNTELALVFDNDLKKYVLKMAQIDGQMNIFDMNPPQSEEDENSRLIDMDQTPALEDKTIYVEPTPEEDIATYDEDYKYDEPEEEYAG